MKQIINFIVIIICLMFCVSCYENTSCITNANDKDTEYILNHINV